MTSPPPRNRVSSWEDISGILATGVRRSKKIRKILLTSFVIDIFLTLGLLYNTTELYHAEQQAAIATCVSTNHIHKDNLHLWNYTLRLIDKNGKPTKAVLTFEKYLDKATEQRNCNVQ